MSLRDDVSGGPRHGCLPALVPVLVRPRELAATSRLGLEGDLVARGLRPLDKAVRVFVPACLDPRTRRGAFGAGAEGGSPTVVPRGRGPSSEDHGLDFKEAC